MTNEIENFKLCDIVEENYISEQCFFFFSLCASVMRVMSYQHTNIKLFRVLNHYLYINKLMHVSWTYYMACLHFFIDNSLLDKLTQNRKSCETVQAY